MSELLIRNVTLDDLDMVANVEAQCFPKAEAAPKSAIKERIEVYSKGFFVAELDNKVIGFINSGATNASAIVDEFFESMDLHLDDGKNLVVYSLAVSPEYQGKGYAAELLNHFSNFGETENKEASILTCKEPLISYYERFGYNSFGVSGSTHGGATWYDMILKF